jgi:hypothetical protein
MPTFIKNIRQRNLVEFDKGSFDVWCVYLTMHDQPRYAPKDVEYFTILKELGNRHGHQKIYDDFVKFYIPTSKTIDAQTLDLITQITNDYNKDAEEMDIWFTVIYAAMVAEENKAKTALGKRIKRLGMHQLLIENKKPAYAAGFSKGKKVGDLKIIMAAGNF